MGKTAAEPYLADSAVRLTCRLFLVFGLTTIALGCAGSSKVVEYSKVSGRVLYNGNPLPGGSVAFVASQETSSGIIDENGNYSVNAPVGEVKIAVDNQMLLPGVGMQKRLAQKMGAGPRPGGPDLTTIKGKYVPIPPRYYTPESSGLTYIVKRGEQSYDVVMTD